MAKPRVLYIVHNHPALHPGGTEIVSRDLFREMRDSGRMEALYLACTNGLHRERKPGTSFQTVGRSADEVLLWTGHVDRFFLSQLDLGGVVADLRALLTDWRPDVVHVHHALMIGVEMLFLVRRLLPRARIIFTLHDYYPICHREGQMLKATDDTLCHRASHDDCHKCFPRIDPWQFSLRERHLKTLFSVVDRFVAPSRFLKERYVAWGLEAERITVVPNGRHPVAPAPHRPLPPGGHRNAFGFFGHINLFKGANVLLDAAGHLVRAGRRDFAVHLHGGMLYQTDEFRVAFREKLDRLAGVVTWYGPYDTGDLPGLIAGTDWVVMPSIWWENAPLVIEEAFAHNRPVLCTGIGGMAERVAHGVNGLHFAAASSQDLAAAMARALDEPGLWERLSAAVPPTVSIAESARLHRVLYGLEEADAVA
ncbi:glycosyltransferase family 4 protein [Azospirillum halopraeferens]|uniref:glycosyltransferase family 4 protein n=1 Tax=Azospirillum halopraeferens TaxID=34010 RepID=UPI0004170C23|nr:glycosyltransferase family 4 protein [Azospirillum halopraeferens]